MWGFGRFEDRLARIDTLLFHLIRQGRREMAQIDDLKAALDADSAKVDVVAAGVTALGHEVAALIAMLQAHPAAQDLAPEIAVATSIGTRLDAVQAAVAAVPPVPPA